MKKTIQNATFATMLLSTIIFGWGCSSDLVETQIDPISSEVKSKVEIQGVDLRNSTVIF